MISFSQKVKNEILDSLSLNECCVCTFLATVIECSDVVMSGGQTGFCLTSTNLDLLKLVSRLAGKFDKNVQGEEYDILCQTSGAKQTYSLTVLNKSLMYACRVLEYDDEGMLGISRQVNDDFLQSDCCKKAYAQALFLCCGSVVVPSNSQGLQQSKSAVGYKLELMMRTLEGAKQAVKILAEYNIALKLIERKSNFTVYAQDADGVSDALILLDANKCLFEVEDLKIERSLRNNANRQTNCEVANIDKSTQAAQRQIEAITFLISTGSMNWLDPKLKEIANLRLDNPDANIAELAAKLSISKSGAVHRMNRLLAEADRRRKNNG